MAKASKLQIRLIRASEMTTHGKEVNLGSAGLVRIESYRCRQPYRQP